VNTLSVRLIAEQIERRQLGSQEIAAALALLPARIPAEDPDLPPIARAYILAAAGDRSRLERIGTEMLSLPLDAAVIRGLQQAARGHAPSAG
jgi:hypothetical protein